MAWGSARRESWRGAVTELTGAAETFRTALLAVAEEPRPELDLPARRHAQAVCKEFWRCANALPRGRGRGRTRRLAVEWENAAAMRFWHHRDVYARAETLGFALLTQLPEDGAPSGPRWLEFRDAHRHATELLDREMRSSGELALVMRAAKAFNAHQGAGGDAALAAAAAAANEPDAAATVKPARRRYRPRDRGPLADQAELRWRISSDRFTLNSAEIFGADDAITREASRLYRPWLDDVLTRLDEPLPVSALELIAVEWRERRAPFRDDPEWADVIVVEPIPRQPATRRWCRRHGDEPTPPLSGSPAG